MCDLTIEDVREILPGKVGLQMQIFNEIQLITAVQKSSDLADSRSSSFQSQVVPSDVSSMETDDGTDPVRESLACYYCLEPISDPIVLWQHLKYLHGVSQSSTYFRCTLCTTTFVHSRSFRRHITNCAVSMTHSDIPADISVRHNQDLFSPSDMPTEPDFAHGILMSQAFSPQDKDEE